MEDAEHKLIRERAAEWVCELHDDTRERHAAFCEWVRQSPRHIEEFLLAATAWKALDAVGPEDEQQVEQAIARAVQLAAKDEGNVVPLQDLRASSTMHAISVTAGRRPGWSIAAGFTVLILGALGWWGASTFVLAPTYSTAIGEQRTMRLADGSVVYLNTDTRARVRYSAGTRSVQLIRGEALFMVARDTLRPFRVDTGTAVIQAVGTQFNVRKRLDGTQVSVIEGRVKVGDRESLLGSQQHEDGTQSVSTDPTTTHRRPAPGADTPARVKFLGAGEEATIARNGHIVKIWQSVQDVSDAVAWRERRLVFRNKTLAEIVNEVNRYGSQRRFRIEGNTAGERRFAGTFSADDPQALVRFLQQYDDLAVDSTPREFVIRQK